MLQIAPKLLSRPLRASRSRLPCAPTLLFAWIAAFSLVPPAQSADLTGQPAPDFALRSLGGENIRLSEHLGEVVLINFWATWCGPCRQEMPQLDQLFARYRRAGLVLLGINIDEDTERAAEMARTLRISYPLLLDDRKEASRAYRVGTMPVTVLIDRAGTVRYVSTGYKPGYEQRYAAQLRELLNE